MGHSQLWARHIVSRRPIQDFVNGLLEAYLPRADVRTEGGAIASQQSIRKD